MASNANGGGGIVRYESVTRVPTRVLRELAALLAMETSDLQNTEGPRGQPSPSWLADQATRMAQVPQGLLAPRGLNGLSRKIAEKVTVVLGIGESYTELCESHRALDARLMRQIFQHVEREVTVHMKSIHNHDGRYTTDMVLGWTQRLTGLSSLWVDSAVFDQTAGKGFPQAIRFHQLHRPCGACILAVVGGNGQLLCDLRASMLSRMDTKEFREARRAFKQAKRDGGAAAAAAAAQFDYQKSYLPHRPRIWKVVEAYIDCFGDDTAQAIRAQSQELSVKLTKIRLHEAKVLRAWARKKSRAKKQHGGKHHHHHRHHHHRGAKPDADDGYLELSGDDDVPPTYYLPQTSYTAMTDARESYTTTPVDVGSYNNNPPANGSYLDDGGEPVDDPQRRHRAPTTETDFHGDVPVAAGAAGPSPAAEGTTTAAIDSGGSRAPTQSQGQVVIDVTKYQVSEFSDDSSGEGDEANVSDYSGGEEEGEEEEEGPAVAAAAAAAAGPSPQLPSGKSLQFSHKSAMVAPLSMGKGGTRQQQKQQEEVMEVVKEEKKEEKEVDPTGSSRASRTETDDDARSWVSVTVHTYVGPRGSSSDSSPPPPPVPRIPSPYASQAAPSVLAVHNDTARRLLPPPPPPPPPTTPPPRPVRDPAAIIYHRPASSIYSNDLPARPHPPPALASFFDLPATAATATATAMATPPPAPRKHQSYAETAILGSEAGTFVPARRHWQERQEQQKPKPPTSPSPPPRGGGGGVSPPIVYPDDSLSQFGEQPNGQVRPEPAPREIQEHATASLRRVRDWVPPPPLRDRKIKKKDQDQQAAPPPPQVVPRESLAASTTWGDFLE